MYCPQCGILQTKQESRFCSGCGFQLSVVTGLLSTNGVLPGVQAPPPQKLPLSQKKKGMRQGAKLMFASLVMLPIIIGLAVVTDLPGFLLLPFTVFLGGLAWLLYSLIFGEDYSVAIMPPVFQQPRVNPQYFNGPPHLFHTPPPENQRLTVPPPQGIKTGEITHPPSVTESTTRLFDDEQP